MSDAHSKCSKERQQSLSIHVHTGRASVGVGVGAKARFCGSCARSVHHGDVQGFNSALVSNPGWRTRMIFMWVNWKEQGAVFGGRKGQWIMTEEFWLEV